MDKPVANTLSALSQPSHADCEVDTSYTTDPLKSENVLVPLRPSLVVILAK